MSYRKKSLSITRFICLVGIPVVWCIAIINIIFQYINTQKQIALASNIGANLRFNFDSLFGDNLNIDSQKIAPDNFSELAIQILIVNSGIVVVLALLLTGLLGITISIIDMRNIEAMKLHQMYVSNRGRYNDHTA